MRKAVLSAGAVITVAGCATVSQMTATGGSRADGIVKLSFEAGMFDRIQIDPAAALATARKRCSVWGYNDAEPFGGHTRQCQQSSAYGCMQWFVTVEYQCTSTGAGSIAGASAPALQNTGAPISAASNDLAGTIDLGSGVKLVPAKTISGYCIKAPAGYQGTGSVNRPSVTDARPKCSS